ncbi:MAG: general secretion pathway protein GspK [Candidatus Omnitrophica bacterium]|nr:general secretion pathway protein GspK [Candidatus Omnitrophota bacterium]
MFQFLSPNRKSSGTILISVLWILVILTVLTVSLGRNTHIELALVKNAVAKARSKYLAWAGVVYAMGHIRRDTGDAASARQDTLYRCGIRLEEGAAPEDLFKGRLLGDGSFDIQYPAGLPARGGSAFGGETGGVYYGLQDEERRINLNALALDNARIFSTLLVNLGFDEQTALTVAYSVLDWKDADHNLVDQTYGAEDDYYRSLAKPLRCKNRPFDSPEELLLVRGVTPEIYQALQDYVTVYPKQGILRINFDTASGTVMAALALAVAKMLPDTQPQDAQSLVDKILSYRRGEDGVEFTADDRLIELNQIPLNAVERNIFLAMTQYRTSTSDYLRVRVKGTEKNRGAVTWLEAVVYRPDLSILSWDRN